ncbi:MAG: hypothetical protein ACYTFO_05455 [Planctomycetota bacterium]|jgi:hypothetical protein
MDAIDPSRRTTTGKGHLLTLIGFALLCVSFFLPYPAIYAPVFTESSGPGPEASVAIHCYGEGIPTQERPGMSPAMVAFAEGHAVRYFLGPGFPFVLGASGLCLYLLPRLMRAGPDSRWVTRAPQVVFGVLLVWAAGVICAALIRFLNSAMIYAQQDVAAGARGPNSSPPELPVAVPFCVFTFIAGFGSAAVFFSSRHIRRPLGAFFCALISLPVFVYHGVVVIGVEHIGPFLAAMACIGPFVAAFGCVLVIIGGLRGAHATRARGPATSNRANA